MTNTKRDLPIIAIGAAMWLIIFAAWAIHKAVNREAHQAVVEAEHSADVAAWMKAAGMARQYPVAICHDRVMYLQFERGVTVAIDPATHHEQRC